MDFKSRSIASWAGNIYQKFETMCHEVDNIVSEDTVNYVGNQVHAMKRFCSDVLQDIRPPPTDPTKCKTQVFALNENSMIGTHKESMIGAGEDTGRTSTLNQSHSEPSDFDLMKSQLIGHHRLEQLPTLAFEKIHEGAQSDLTSEKAGENLENYNYDVTVKEDVKESYVPEELMTAGDKDSFEASLLNDFTDGGTCGNAHSLLREVPPESEVHAEEFLLPQKVGVVCSIPSHASDSVFEISSDLASSEIDIPTSGSSIFLEPRTLAHNSLHDAIPRTVSSSEPANNSDCLNTLVSISSASDTTGSTKFTSSNNVLSLEMIDASAGCYDDASCITYDLLDSGMETIDLYDKVKPEESCAFADSSMLYEVYRRTQRLRSYKKKLQDAFASKRKLTKEYEQLAIFYGDLDMESGQDAVQGQLPSSTTVTVDSEWELL